MWFLPPRSCAEGKLVALILVAVTQNHPDTWTHGHLSRQNFLKCLRYISGYPRNFGFYCYLLDSSESDVWNPEQQNWIWVGFNFPRNWSKYGRVTPKSFYTKGCWDCLKTWVTQSREDLISLAIKWNFWPTKWWFCLWFSTACFIISRKMAFDQSQMLG